MKLRDVLQGKNQVYVAEYMEMLGDQEFIGGCFYAEGRLISLDMDAYSLEVEVKSYEWREANDVKVVLA